MKYLILFLLFQSGGTCISLGENAFVYYHEQFGKETYQVYLRTEDKDLFVVTRIVYRYDTNTEQLNISSTETKHVSTPIKFKDFSYKDFPSVKHTYQEIDVYKKALERFDALRNLVRLRVKTNRS